MTGSEGSGRTRGHASRLPRRCGGAWRGGGGAGGRGAWGGMSRRLEDDLTSSGRDERGRRRSTSTSTAGAPDLRGKGRGRARRRARASTSRRLDVEDEQHDDEEEEHHNSNNEPCSPPQTTSRRTTTDTPRTTPYREGRAGELDEDGAWNTRKQACRRERSAATPSPRAAELHTR